MRFVVAGGENLRVFEKITFFCQRSYFVNYLLSDNRVSLHVLKFLIIEFFGLPEDIIIDGYFPHIMKLAGSEQQIHFPVF